MHCIVNGWENHRIVPLAERIGASWSTGFYNSDFSRRTFNPLRLARMAGDIVRTSAGLLRAAWSYEPTHVFLPDYMSVIRNALTPPLRARGLRLVMRLGNAPDAGAYGRLWRWGINPLVDRFVCNSRKYTEQEPLSPTASPGQGALIYNICAVMGRSEALRGRTAVGASASGKSSPTKAWRTARRLAVLAARGYAATLDVVGSIDGWTTPSYRGFRERISPERAARPDLAGRVRFSGGATMFTRSRAGPPCTAVLLAGSCASGFDS